MRDFFEKALVVVGLLLVGAVAGVILLTMIDPACGPLGDDQISCARQLADDLRSGGR